MIKKLTLLFLLYQGCFGISTYRSKSFLAPRTILEDNTYTLFPLNLPNKQNYSDQNYSDHDSFINISPLYIKSTQKDKTAAYFLFGSQCMTIGDENSNVAPEWFGLEAPVGQSIDTTFSLSPQRSTVGLLLFGGYNFNNHIFATIALPIVHVKHFLNMHECRAGALGIDTCIKTFASALNQSSWCHGKFCTTCITKTNIDDIGINLGYKIKNEQPILWSIYAKGIIPTGKKQDNPEPCATYLFEPIVGSRHFGLGAGMFTNLQKVFSHVTLEWFTILDYIYRLRAKEYRSFDLCNNGYWSRYLLLVNQNDTTTPLDGINILTPQANITPRHRGEFTTGIRIAKEKYSFTLGYNLWIRASEFITSCKNLSCYGIFNTNETSADGTTASTATINVPPRSVTQDSSFVSIGNINIDSGRQPTSINNKIFGGFTRNFANDEIKKIKVEIWGSYEHTHKNSALSQWSIWGNVGFEF